MEAKDTEALWNNNFPSQPRPDCIIITFQNNGLMSNYILQPKPLQIARLFKVSNASVALYAKHSLNKPEIPSTHHFHQRMTNTNPKSLSKISCNIHAKNNTLWNYPGGTTLTMDATTKAHMLSSGKDSTGLIR